MKEARNNIDKTITFSDLNEMKKNTIYQKIISHVQKKNILVMIMKNPANST